jgi:hypothetical protein
MFLKNSFFNEIVDFSSLWGDLMGIKNGLLEKGSILTEGDLERLGLEDTENRFGFPRLHIYRNNIDRVVNKVYLLPIEKVYKVCIIDKNKKE